MSVEKRSFELHNPSHSVCALVDAKDSVCESASVGKRKMYGASVEQLALGLHICIHAVCINVYARACAPFVRECASRVGENV